MTDADKNLDKFFKGAFKVKNRRRDDLELEIPTPAVGPRSSIPKKRTCENCSCSRSKDENSPKLTRDELTQLSKEEFFSLANGGCQGCKMGDAFRCSDCPFQGLPAFKEGDDVFFG